MNLIDFSVLKGCIYAYRIFNIGNETELSQAQELLRSQMDVSNYSLKSLGRSMLINENPLCLILDPWTEFINGCHFKIIPYLKLWSFGTISVKLKLDLHEPVPIRDLCEISHYMENSDAFHERTVASIRQILDILNPSIEKPELWSQYEDYLLFCISETDSRKENIREIFYGNGISSLILGEKYMEFSDQINDSVASTIFQYEKNDLLLIHWNGAILYDQEYDENILSVFEFTLCQLLELRYYDFLLDHQLKALYSKVENPGGTILRNPYSELSRYAALEYIEISDIVDKVGNAFKVIGDFYYATIFRSATEKFHIPLWRKIVDHKLGNLAEVSRLFQGEVNEKRNQLLEGVIIILIAIEVIPFLISLGLK